MPTARLDSPFNQFGRRKPQPVPPGVVPPAEIPAATQPQSLIQPRALSLDVMAQLKTLQDRINTAPMTPQDIMNGPEFKAQASAIDFSQGQALAGVRRDLASRGMLRGTPSVQALSAETARFEASKNALVPQMLSQALARRQQDIANSATLLSTTSGLQDTAFNQGLSEFNALTPFTRLTKAQEADQAFRESGRASDLAFKEADITGRYLSPEARALAERVLSAKASNPLGQDPAAAQQANDARSQLASLGFDASLLGSDVTLDQARQNLGRLGIQTPEAQKRDAQQERDTLATEMARLEADIARNPDVGAMAQARQKMLEGAKRMEHLDAQIKQANAKSLSGGGSGFTAWQQYQIERDKQGDTTKAKTAAADKTAAAQEKATAAREKAREKLVDSFRKDYKVSQPGADLWADFMDLAVEPNPDGTQPTRDELDKTLGEMLRKTPTITNDDIGWARAMFWSGQGDQTAQDTLNKLRKDAP